MNYIAMNRFRVSVDGAADFEDMWRTRESRLQEVPGFIEFRMLKGAEEDGIRTYSSHVIWESKADFENWTQSDHFRAAHANVGKSEGRKAIMGPPKFEGFESILYQDMKGS
ncbi:MAG: antibiotic biosynthesis monooxygenase [Pseudomonadota bacterium]